MYNPFVSAIISTRTLVECGNQVLVVERHPHEEQPGLWELPGGKINPGEPIIIGAARETHEETGLHVHMVTYQPELIEDRIIPDGKHQGRRYQSYGFVATANAGATVMDRGEQRAKRWVYPWMIIAGMIEVTPTTLNTLRIMEPQLTARPIRRSLPEPARA